MESDEYGTGWCHREASIHPVSVSFHLEKPVCAGVPDEQIPVLLHKYHETLMQV
jgi:hypothetical protein